MNKHTINARGLDIIRRREGCKLVAYICPAGKLTIGYGHIISKEERTRLQRITPAQADELMQHDVKRFEQYIRDSVKIELTEDQFSALVSFVFNIGPENFRTSTLLRKLNKGDVGGPVFDEQGQVKAWSGATAEFIRWNKITDPKTGKKIPLSGLTKRRKDERELFCSIYPGGVNAPR